MDRPATSGPVASPRSSRTGKVRVEIAEAPDRKSSIIAEITPAAVADLELVPGSEVWAAVKASDIEVYSATWFRAASVLFLH